MDTKRRIIVGVDGSVAGQRALRWAMAEAASGGGTVEAITIFTFRETDAASFRDHEAQWASTEQMLRAQIRSAREVAPPVEVTPTVLYGSPADELANAGPGADLLVLGGKRHHGLFHATLGRVAEKCLRTAGCPVVVVPEPHSLPPAEADDE